jgi:hypothetical protein
LKHAGWRRWSKTRARMGFAAVGSNRLYAVIVGGGGGISYFISFAGWLGWDGVGS